MSHSLELLRTPYAELPVSKSLKRAFTLQKCDTLESLLKKSGREIMVSKGFGDKTMKELYQFMKANKIEHMLL